LPHRGVWAQASEGAPKAGGKLSFVIHPEPTTLVCFNTTEGPAIQASTKVVEGLLAYDFDLNPKPQLATTWSVSEVVCNIASSCAATSNGMTAIRSQRLTSSIRCRC
jgi:ABC-type transport system substrate-binding protein